jgi:APA family basic amino acid/polyamine antiporter
MANPWITKPIGNSEVSSSGPGNVHRHYSLTDLVSIGLGGTIGSGIFVLSGFIAKNYAGPATSLSFLISGVCATLSGMCYAELSTYITTSGSAYAYVYSSLGELPAVIAAACLTLEYLISGAAVARSWGDKCLEWFKMELGAGPWVDTVFAPFGPEGLNPLAGILSALTVWLLATGVKESKSVTNFVTSAKVFVVLFMTVGGFFLYDSNNLSPYIPPQFGWTGVLRGATSSFFGYLGYDEVCCVAGEALNPLTDVPHAVMGTILSVAVLYFFASMSLTSMQPYSLISETSGFADAFQYRNVNWAGQIAALGEVLTLPLVVLVSLLAQPRVFYAMSCDGLLPPVFKETDASGNLTKGILYCGIVMTLVASFIPFTFLNDMISAGVLLSFSLTDTGLLVLRRKSGPGQNPNLLKYLLAGLNGGSFILGIWMAHFATGVFGIIVAVIGLLGIMYLVYTMANSCPGVVVGNSANAKTFKTPLLPYLPSMAIMINWFLIAQLELYAIGMLMVYIALWIGVYFVYGVHHSVGNNQGWKIEDGDDGRKSIEMGGLSGGGVEGGGGDDIDKVSDEEGGDEEGDDVNLLGGGTSKALSFSAMNSLHEQLGIDVDGDA